MGSFNQYISTDKQCRPFFPTIPHSNGSQQDDRRWHLIYHSRPCSPLPWKLTLMRTFDNRTDTNDTWKTMPLDEPLLIACQISAILHSFFPFLFTLMCSSFLIISVSLVHVSLIREKTNEPDANRNAAVDKYKRYLLVVFLYELTTGTMDITRGDRSVKYCRNVTLMREEDIYRSDSLLLD
jgi:hypothetical protein